MILKDPKHMIEKLVEPFKHADAIKHVVNDIKPPQSFTLFEPYRIHRGKYRWRSFAERSAKRLFDRRQRIRLL